MHEAVSTTVLVISPFSVYDILMSVPHLGRIFLVSLGHIIEMLDLGDVSLREDLLYMVFWLLMVMSGNILD